MSEKPNLDSSVDSFQGSIGAIEETIKRLLDTFIVLENKLEPVLVPENPTKASGEVGPVQEAAPIEHFFRDTKDKINRLNDRINMIIDRCVL